MNKIIMVLMSVWVAHILAVTPKDTVTINGVKATVRASSELSSKTPGRYAVKNLFDNDPATVWVEGVAGNGIGEISLFSVFPGIEVSTLRIEYMTVSCDRRELNQALYGI